MENHNDSNRRPYSGTSVVTAFVTKTVSYLAYLEETKQWRPYVYRLLCSRVPLKFVFGSNCLCDDLLALIKWKPL